MGHDLQSTTWFFGARIEREEKKTRHIVMQNIFLFGKSYFECMNDVNVDTTTMKMRCVTLQIGINYRT